MIKKLYIVQDNDDYKRFRISYPQTLQSNERLVYNDDPSAYRKLMGMRLASVYFTPEVLMAGMNPDLLYTLMSSFISSNINPNKAFRLIS